MNVSKQEPEVPSKETSEKEVRESYIVCSTEPKDISSKKMQDRHYIETDFIRPGESKKLYNFFDTSTVPNLMERDGNFFSFKARRLEGKESVKGQASSK